MQKQDEFDDMLYQITLLPEFASITKPKELTRFKTSLIESGEKVYKSNLTLIAQLRSLISEKHILENRRIKELIAEIEKQAIKIRLSPPSPQSEFIELETSTKPQSFFSRQFWEPNETLAIHSKKPSQTVEEIEGLSVLFSQLSIDKNQLRQQVNQCLEGQSQVNIEEIILKFPPKNGVAEIISYYSLGSEIDGVVTDESNKILMTISSHKKMRVPNLIFTRPI